MVVGLTIFISSAVAIVVAELVLRLFFVDTPVKVSVDSSLFPVIPGIYQPTETAVSRINPNLPHEITINNLGYRGEDFSAEKPAGEIRIFMTGDSFMFGDLVSDEQSLPQQLGKILQSDCPNVRVVNGALAGSTIVAQANLIQRATQIDPDIVVLSFHDNDLGDLRDPLWYRLERNRKLRSKFPFTLHSFLIRNSAIYVLLKNTYDRLRSPQITVTTQEVASPDAFEAERRELEEMKALYRASLEDIYLQLKAENRKLFFLVYPGHPNLKDPKPSANDTEVDWFAHNLWVEQTAREIGIPVLNLQRTFLDEFADTESGYLFPHDGHPSETGHAVAARATAEFEPFRSALSDICRLDTSS